MPIRLIIISLAVFVATSAKGLCEQKTFTETIRVVMGSRETQEEAREYALLEAKRRVLEKVGVYMAGQTELVQRVRETAASFKDETDLKRQIQTVTAGVTQTEVSGEEWKTEGGVFVLYLTCCVTVETGDVERRIAETLKDRQKTEAYVQLQIEVDRLRGELDTLRRKLEQASPAQVSQLSEKRKTIATELSASDWFEKGFAATDPDDKIACYSIAISINPNWSGSYINRGVAYREKGDYDRAIADYDHALQIDPNNALAYSNRGLAYYNKSDLDRAIADYNRAMQIDQNNALAYINRGIAYYDKGELDRAIADYNRALQIDPNDAKTYYNRGLAYHNKGDLDQAIADYNRALQIDPNLTRAYHNRELAYKNKGDSDPDDFIPTGDVHIVRRGETLSSIASRYGVTMSQIIRLNNLNSKKRLYANQRLIINIKQKLSVDAEDDSITDNNVRIHIVETGESLWLIARKYGVSVEALRQVNGLQGRSLIKTGQKLRIPNPK